jgi:hypothetical protein
VNTFLGPAAQRASARAPARVRRGVAREGTFERFTFFDTQLIERLFRAEVLRLLMAKGLISQDIVDNLLSWRHSGWLLWRRCCCSSPWRPRGGRRGGPRA